MRVRVGSTYIYSPNLLDIVDGRTGLKDGEPVKVVNYHGCPRANTMGHCYVVRTSAPDVFVGLVHCNSLHTKQDRVYKYRKPKATLRRACGDCCARHSFGRFDERFLLTFVESV